MNVRDLKYLLRSACNERQRLDAVRHLSGANLRAANLRHADLRAADLRGADLSDADLYGADLWHADLCRANLRHADLRHADLRHADLRHADLWHADLRHANLRHADLRHANLWRADLRHADLTLIGRWGVSLRSENKCSIGCETRTFDQWDAFFWHENAETLETSRDTMEFESIRITYEWAKALRKFARFE